MVRHYERGKGDLVGRSLSGRIYMGIGVVDMVGGLWTLCGANGVAGGVSKLDDLVVRVFRMRPFVE